MAKHIFDIANTARDAWGARVCTQEELEIRQASESVRENCQKATEAFEGWTEQSPDEETVKLKQEAAEYKRMLPVVLPHAHFTDGHRCNASAEESGLMSMDFDHIRDPRAFYDEHILPHKDELHLVWAFISPTGTGVKTVSVKPKNLNLEEAQAWFAGVVGVDDYDHTHDLARCVYLVPNDYNLHYDAAQLFGDGDEFQVEKPSTGGDSPSDAEAERVTEESVAKRKTALLSISYDPEAAFSGVPYSKIAEAYWQEKYGKQPQEGMRHQALMDWVRDAACICEYSAEKLMAVTPRLSKDADELASIISDTLGWKKKNFRPTMAYTLQKVLKKLCGKAGEKAASTGVEAFNQHYLDRMPTLPPALRAAINGIDKKYHLAVIFGMLPVFCSFAERVIYKHCDHSLRRPTLFYFCVGPSSSGKDNVTRRYRALTSKLQDEDMVSRDMNDEVRDSNNTKSADEKGKLEKTYVKQRALDITSSDLLRWMKISRKKGHVVEGRLLPRKVLMFDSEAGSVRKAVKNGTLMVNWRKGFDCDRMAADRSTSMATSGDEEVCIDIVAMCTPRVLKTLISSDSQEDGTASRLLITFIPGDPYSDMPIKEEVTDKDRDIMQQGLELCANAEGIIDSPRLRKILTEWNNKVGREAQENDDLARAMLRRRACIMGMCAAIICAILWNKKRDGKLQLTKPAIDFGLLTAEYSMETACAVHEDYGENTTMTYHFTTPFATRSGKNQVLFDMLDDVFTRDDIVKAKPGINKSAISNIIKRYTEQGLIEEVERLKYRKLQTSTQP